MCIRDRYSTISVSILITSVLNCASDGLAISSLLSCIFSGALICDLFFHLGHFFFLSRCACYIKGQSLRCSLGRGKAGCCTGMLYVGKGSDRGIVPFVQLSASFQLLPPLPTSKLGPSGAYSRVGGLVYNLGPCGLSNELSCEAGSVSCYHLNPHACFESEV